MCDRKSIAAIAASSQNGWRFLCAFAELSKQLLCFNRDVSFSAPSAAPQNAVVSFTTGTEFVLVDSDRLDIATRDPDYATKLVGDAVGFYPNRSDWCYSSSEFESPEAIHNLLLWMPNSAHDRKGFFPLSGTKERPKHTSGFLDVDAHLVRLLGTRFAKLEQYWNTTASTHNTTHGRLPAAPERDPCGF